MRALTLIQPWAHAIVRLPDAQAKRVENRTWPPPETLLGRRFAIHAGKAWDNAAHLCWPEGLPPPERHECTRGAIVGVATLLGWLDFRNYPVGEVRSVGLDSKERARHLDADPWWNGPVGWLLGDVVSLMTPVPCRGALGLWELPSAVEQRVFADEAARALAVGLTYRDVQ